MVTRVPYPEASKALLRDTILDAMRDLLLDPGASPDRGRDVAAELARLLTPAAERYGAIETD